MGGRLKIVDARVIVCSPGRNFVTLKVTTEDGIHGLVPGILRAFDAEMYQYGLTALSRSVIDDMRAAAERDLRAMRDEASRIKAPASRRTPKFKTSCRYLSSSTS